MRVKSTALLVFILCLVPVVAQADITRISPSSIPYGAAEETLSIFGTELSGTESTFVVFDGPGGQFFVLPANAIPNEDDPEAPPQYPSNLLVASVPGGIPFAPGPYQINVIAKDVGQDARTLGPVIFTVGDAPVDGPPIFTYTETVVQEAANSEGAFVNFDVSAQSPNGDPVPVTCSRTSGSQFAIGTTPVSCSATNSFGTSMISFIVVVADQTNPVVTVPDDITSTSPVVTFEASAVDNIDGPLPVTCSPSSGSTFNPGVTQVTCRATDSNNNTGIGTFLVILEGGEPVLTVPADITVTSPDDQPVVVDYTVTATNDATITCLPAGNTTFSVGTTVVTCTATNLTGSDTKSFKIIVQSGSTPEITVPDDIVAEATSPDGAVVEFEATATNGATIVCTPASGSTFALGVTTVSCTATNAGGSDTDTFTVTVVDSTPPQILSVDANPGVLWPPNHQMVNVSVVVVAVDVADPAPVSQIISVTSNQPINGTGDGDVAPDWVITGPLTVQLRSERAGSQDRIYTITVQTTDASGNTTTATDTVVVSNARRRAVH